MGVPLTEPDETTREVRLYDVKAIAAETKLSAKYIWNQIAAGRIRTFTIGKRRLVRHADLVAWIDAQGTEA